MKAKLNLFLPLDLYWQCFYNLLQEGPKPGVETEGVILDYDRFTSDSHLIINPIPLPTLVFSQIHCEESERDPCDLQVFVQ